MGSLVLTAVDEGESVEGVNGGATDAAVVGATAALAMLPSAPALAIVICWETYRRFASEEV